MPTKKTDSSAVRKNPFSNDTADSVVIDSVMALWDFASVLDQSMAEFSRDALVDTLQMGFALREASPATWAAFLDHPLWKKHPKRRPKKDEQQDAPKFVLQIYFGQANRATKRTSDYWRALQHLEEEGFSSSDIVEEMVKGEAVVRAICGRRAEQQRRKTDAAKAFAVKPAHTSAIGSSTPPDQPIPALDASVQRAIAISQKATLLTFPMGVPELKVGETYTIIIKVLAGGGHAFEGKALKVKPRKPKNE